MTIAQIDRTAPRSHRREIATHVRNLQLSLPNTSFLIERVPADDIQTIPTNVNTVLELPTMAYDDTGAHPWNPADNTFTIPQGWQRATFNIWVSMGGPEDGQRLLGLFKNDNELEMRVRYVGTPAGNQFQLVTPAFVVQPGDVYFSYVFQNSGVDVHIGRAHFAVTQVK